MVKIRLLLFLGIVSLIFSCSPKSGATKSKSGTVNEDLAAYRPAYEVEPKEESKKGTDSDANLKTADVKPVNDVTQEINSALDSLESRNSGQRLVQGYTIQVYSGNSREAANEAKSLVYKTFPDSRPETTYVQPNYKVKVGKYLSRMEAQKLYALLRNDFPGAMVVPEKIKLSQF